jgi:hypothetical protein
MNKSYATIYALSDPSIEKEVVIKALEQAGQPVTAKQLRERLTGPYKLPKERLSQLLEEQVSAGRIHHYAAIGPSKQPRYFSRRIEDYARELIINLLEQRSHTQTEILRKLKSQLAGMSQHQQKNLLTLLVKEKQVYQLPPFIGSRTIRYSSQPPDLRNYDYLEDAIEKIRKKLNLTPEEVLSAARAFTLLRLQDSNSQQNDLSEKLLARMLQVKLAAAYGELVPLSELWRSLQNEGWDKASFDRTVLGLADKYRVSLQRHNFPASLSEPERNELVADGLGNYYVGIALR